MVAFIVFFYSSFISFSWVSVLHQLFRQLTAEGLMETMRLKCVDQRKFEESGSVRGLSVTDRIVVVTQALVINGYNGYSCCSPHMPFTLMYLSSTYHDTFVNLSKSFAHAQPWKSVVLINRSNFWRSVIRIDSGSYLSAKAFPLSSWPWFLPKVFPLFKQRPMSVWIHHLGINQSIDQLIHVLSHLIKKWTQVGFISSHKFHVDLVIYFFWVRYWYCEWSVYVQSKFHVPWPCSHVTSGQVLGRFTF